MTSLVSPATVKAIVKTSLTDAQLQVVIDRIEAEITARIGAPQDDGGTVSVVQTLEGGTKVLFLPTEILSVVSIVEDDVTLASSDYRTWSGGDIERMPVGTRWGEVCVVTYKPTDNRSLRTQVIIELARLDIERTAFQAESVSDYSYTAPKWDEDRKKQFRRLMFTAV
jgi:hypothetical protein